MEKEDVLGRTPATPPKAAGAGAETDGRNSSPADPFGVSMAQFYFHLHNDIDVPDDEGHDLPDLQAARAHAMHQARMLVGELAKDEGRIVLHHRIDIEDEHGTVLDSVQFRDVVSIES